MKQPNSTNTASDLAASQEQQRAAHRRRSNTMTSSSAAQGDLIGAIDQGTSSTRFLVFEQGTGQLVASSQIEIKRLTPCEGWVEIDPNVIMSSVYATMANVHDQLEAWQAGPSASSTEEDETRGATGGVSGSASSSRLKCIGICNQRESAVVWDSKTGKPLYNVIVWMDNRTKDIVDKMIDSMPGRDFNQLKDKTGLPMSTYFSAFKLKWLIDNVSEVRAALDDNRLLFGTVDSWILWNLTGRHLTDVTNASRTFLMDIETLRWDKSLCKLFKVPMKILPKILSSADDFGQIQFGPFMGIPITGVIGDQSAALFGHNCLQMGQTKATFGTGCFIMQNIGPGPLNGGALSGVQREAKRGLITTVGYKLRDRPACYALEGSIKIAGAALTWLRDNMQLIQNYEECDQLINLTTNSAGVFFVPALGGLYSPYWDPNAAGLFIGLSQFSRREHLVRATFDSIAFQTNDILSLMHGVTSGLMIDGGLCKSDNLCQILADITGCDINRPAMCETSALGAAMVAGFGAGIWSYESMLAQSNTPYDFSSATNQNHHYPHESLHYDDNKFSALIQSKKTFKSQEAATAQRQQQQTHHQPQQQQQHNRRSLRHRAGGRLMRNLDAGGGINDDAGGGGGGGGGPVAGTNKHGRPQHASNCYTDDDDEDDDDDDELASSSGQLASCSEAGDSAKAEDVFVELSNSKGLCGANAENDETEKRLAQLNRTNLSSSSNKSSSRVIMSGLMQLNQHHMNHMAPSSGYSSGDNFEAATTNSADSCQLLTDSIRCRLDSPTSQATDLMSSVSVDENNLPAHGRDSVATCTDLTFASRRANGATNLSPVDPDDQQQVISHSHYSQSAAASANIESVVQQEQQDKFVANAEGVADEVHEFGGRDSYGEDGYDSSTVSFDSYDDEQNGIDEEVARLSGLVISDSRTSLDTRQDTTDVVGRQQANISSQMTSDDKRMASLDETQMANGHHQHKRRQSSLIEKHMDVFQPYISLEHRTDLVNTWHLAVGRSMQWTKVHHEEWLSNSINLELANASVT